MSLFFIFCVWLTVSGLTAIHTPPRAATALRVGELANRDRLWALTDAKRPARGRARSGWAGLAPLQPSRPLLLSGVLFLIQRESTDL